MSDTAKAGTLTATQQTEAIEQTTVEMVQKEDVENVIKLIYETLLTIGPDDDFSYFK